MTILGLSLNIHVFITMTLDWDHKINSKSQLYNFGIPFEATSIGSLMTASDLGCIFFAFQPLNYSNVVLVR